MVDGLVWDVHTPNDSTMMRMWQELPEENQGQVGTICSTVRSEYLEDDFVGEGTICSTVRSEYLEDDHREVGVSRGRFCR